MQTIFIVFPKHLMILFTLLAFPFSTAFADTINLKSSSIKTYYPHILQTHFFKYPYSKEEYSKYRNKPSFELINGPKGFKVGPNGKSSWRPSESDEGNIYELKVKVVLPVVSSLGYENIEKIHYFKINIPKTKLLETEIQGNTIKIKGLECDNAKEGNINKANITVEKEYFSQLKTIKVRKVVSGNYSPKSFDEKIKCLLIIGSPFPTKYKTNPNVKRLFYKLELFTFAKNIEFELMNYLYRIYSSNNKDYEEEITTTTNSQSQIDFYAGGNSILGFQKPIHIGNTWMKSSIRNSKNNVISTKGTAYTIENKIVDSVSIFGLIPTVDYVRNRPRYEK